MIYSFKKHPIHLGGEESLSFHLVVCRTCVNGGGERNRTDGLLRAKQALSQLSYTPKMLGLTQMVVGQGGLEPPTSRLSSVRSNQLSY